MDSIKWANVDFSEYEVDLEVQRAALEPWKEPKSGCVPRGVDAQGCRESHDFRGIQSLCESFCYEDDDPEPGKKKKSTHHSEKGSSSKRNRAVDLKDARPTV